jgi:pimeloyl-ACP methyl ester carboxylesterase
MGDVTGHYVSVSDTRIYYEVTGDEGSPPIVAIHTAGAEGRQWRHAAPLLADAGYRVVVPDLPGHGKSYPIDWEPHDSIHAHAEFVHAFVETLDLEGPVITGCSIGGDTVLDLAVNHSDTIRCGIALEGTGRTTGPPLGRFSHPHALPGWEDVLEYSVIDSTADAIGESTHRELAWQHRNAHAVGTNDLQGWATFDVMDRLDEVTVPILLVRGEEDFFIQEEAFAETVRRLPRSEGVTMAGTGHYPMMERPERTVEIMIDFLARETPD